MDDVFRGSEALRDGKLSRYQLQTGFRAIYPDVYLPRDAAPTLRMRAVAAWLWSGRRGVLAGLAALGLYLIGRQWDLYTHSFLNMFTPEGMVQVGDVALPRETL